MALDLAYAAVRRPRRSARRASASTGPRARRGRAGSMRRQSASAVIALVGARGAGTARARTTAAPMSWRPTGRPSDRPHGTDSPGRPAMLTGSVHASERYIGTGSAIRAPNRNATVGEVGATSASNPASHSVVEVALDQRPDLLRLEVERVVVAGRQRVRAEHDPPLDLGAEALAAGREVVGEVVAAAADAVAVADAVVAGEVRRRLRRRDDVVRREAVVRVREADLLDGRAGRLERRDRLADRAPRRPAPCPSTKYSRGRPKRLPRSHEAASSSEAGRWSESSGTGIGARRRVALVAAGDRVEQRRGVARRRGRTARSGRASWRTPRSRSG